VLQEEWWMNQVDKFNGGKIFSMPGRSLNDLISRLESDMIHAWINPLNYF
jgi:hypothetical protein